MSADSTILRGTTRHLPMGADFDYFLDAVCDLYVGVRPDRPNGPFFADFALFDLGKMHAGLLSTPGVSARRDRDSIARMPDDGIFINFSPLPWELDHRGEHWEIPAGMPFLLDNSEAFQMRFDPSRRLRLYSLRISRANLPDDTERKLHRANLRMRNSEAGRHFAAQTKLFVTMLDADRIDVASAMAGVLLGLTDAITDSDATADRLTSFKEAARARLVEHDYGLTQLARDFRCSPRTVQNVFAAAGERFSEWLTAERLDLARERLTSPDWVGVSVERLARASGFLEYSTFQRAFRRRFGSTPGSIR